MKTGVQLITEERKRQIEVEGWDKEHDSQHSWHELLDAARCYIASSEATQFDKLNLTYNGGYRVGEGVPRNWPWEKESWKPSGNAVRDLVKAGTLIAREIDRLQLNDEKNNNINTQITKEEESFTEAAKPLIKWLCENSNPHATVLVTNTGAELMEGKMSTGETLEYLND